MQKDTDIPGLDDLGHTYSSSHLSIPCEWFLNQGARALALNPDNDGVHAAQEAFGQCPAKSSVVTSKPANGTDPGQRCFTPPGDVTASLDFFQSGGA